MGNDHCHRVFHPDRELRAQHDLVAGGVARPRRQLSSPEHGRQHHHGLQQLLEPSHLRAADGGFQEVDAEMV